jgi:aspartate aminotransferase
MPQVSQRARGMQESAIRKLDALVARQQGVHFHRLNIGQPDVPTPEPMLSAIRNFQPKVVAYGPASGTAACRAAAAAYQARWSPGLGPEHAVITAGGSEGLLFAFTAICDPGDEILVPEPYYTNYNGFATVAGATVRPIRTRIEDAFAIPSDAVLDTLVTPKTRALVLNNPGNPTGVVYSRAELARILAWARRHDLFVIADEVYRQIWFDEPPTSALEFPEYADHVVVIDSLSKTWSACGARAGFLYSRNAELMEKIERLGQARLGPQPLAQEMAIAALNLPDSYYDALRAIWRSRVTALYEGLGRLGLVDVPKPQGAFYLMVRLPVDDADAFARFLVTDFRHEGESVIVAPGSGFYADPADGRQQIRLAAVNDAARLARAIEVLGKGLEAYRG